MRVVTNTPEDRAKAIYEAEVLSCGNGMMPEWEHLDAVSKDPWLCRANAEVAEFMSKTCTANPDEVPVVTTDVS